MLVCVGPIRAQSFGLRAQVEVTGARNILLGAARPIWNIRTRNSWRRTGGAVLGVRGARGRLRKMADLFSVWLERRARASRKHYTKREWADILGAAPFTPEE